MKKSEKPKRYVEFKTKDWMARIMKGKGENIILQFIQKANKADFDDIYEQEISKKKLKMFIKILEGMIKNKKR